MKPTIALLIVWICIFYQIDSEGRRRKKPVPVPISPPPINTSTTSPILASDNPNQQCRATVLPSFINNSMYWDVLEQGKTGGFSVYKAFKALSPPSIVVVAAGNLHPKPLESTKVQASKGFDAILVGSLAPDGRRSGFSQEGDELHIMAPSDHWLTSPIVMEVTAVLAGPVEPLPW